MLATTCLALSEEFGQPERCWLHFLQLGGDSFYRRLRSCQRKSSPLHMMCRQWQVAPATDQVASLRASSLDR